MNIKSLVLLAFCLCAFSAFAQNNHSIKGITIDTTSKSKVSSTITILRPDSIMQAFGYAGNDGSFTVGALPSGKYVLLATFPDYADFSQEFTISPTEPVHDFGNINMTLLSKLLNEVVVKGNINALKIKGDTSEFNAKAFVIQPNAKVDDLLKQIPGMEIDQNGNIKFRGEAIKKITVDGEEFFSDDPVLVSRTLRGDMIDKVQVFDKRSDQATFTGVDDGQRTKTINLKLKEDKKVGIFGKVDLAGGRSSDQRGMYAGQVQFNRFRANEKLSLYGTMANTGKVNLSFSDASNLGTQNLTALGDGVFLVNGISDEFDNASFNGRGFPTAKTGGVHYDVKWNEAKQSINTNYRIGSISNDLFQNTITDLLISDQRSNRTTNSSESHTSAFRQKLDVGYQKNTTNTNLRINVDAALRNNESSTASNSSQVDQDNKFVNRSSTSNNSTAEVKLFNASVFYSKKFAKPRRTISWNLAENYSENNVERYAKTNIEYASLPGNTVDQYKPERNSSTVLSSNITYTEPLTAKLTLTFNYLLGINNSISRIESYNKSASGRYDEIDELTTNDYKYNILTNQFGATFGYVTAKTNLNFGTRASNINFNQVDERRLRKMNRSYLNWMPQVNYQYRMTPAKTISINYSGNTQQPSLSQIQPVVNNLNPLYVTVGNPDLKPYFMHSARLFYSSQSTLSGSSFSINGSYSFTANAIISSLTFNPDSGKTTTRFVNLADKTPRNYSLSMQIGRKIVPWEMNIYPQFSFSGNTSYNYTTEAGVVGLNESNGNTFSASLQFSKSKAKKYSLNLSGSLNANRNRNSFSKRSDYSAMGASIFQSGTLYLPGKFEIFSSTRYNYTGPSNGFGGIHRTIWDASVSRTFLKGNNLKLSITGNNLLDQDQNTRNAGGNTITQSSYNVIKRYFMLNLIWDFTKFGTLPSKN